MRGSIVRRGRTYSYVLSLGYDASGRRRQKWVSGFRTKREAEAALTEALERVRVGAWADPGRTTVGEYCREWLVGVQPTLRPSTFASHRDILERWVLSRIGHVRLADLTPTRIRALDAELLASGGRNGAQLSGASVRYAHRILSKALKDAVEQGLLPRNPAAVVRAPRAAQRQPTVWSPAELRSFLDGVADDRLATMWLLLAMTGMRRGEVAALRWSDVDLAYATLSVRAQRVAVEYDVYEYEPKTRAGRRMVSLDARTVEALRMYRKRQRRERFAAGAAWCGDDWVFTNLDGSPLHPDRISKLFEAARDASGLPRIRLHDLRHTSATLALAAGIHPKVVQERLGHANINVTLDTYSHVLRGVHDDSSRRISDIVFGDDDAEHDGSRELPS